MQVPSEWSGYKTKSGAASIGSKRTLNTRERPAKCARARTSTECTGTDAGKLGHGDDHSGAPAATPSNIYMDTYEEILNSADPVSDEHIDVDTVLSGIPYVEILSDVFDIGSRDSASNKMRFASELQTPDACTEVDVPLVTKAYEESFMRERTSKNERLCVMGNACECMKIDPEKGFICVEFQLPNVTQSTVNGMCVICLRKTTQKLFYDMIYRKFIPSRVLIQKYGNIVNKPGEYASDACLICPPNTAVHSMPLPVVAHQRNRYSVVSRHGVRYLTQHRVEYTPNFQ